MAALLEYVFRLDITDRVRIKQEFNVLGKIARAVPFYRLTYPRDFSLLPAVRASIVENLSKDD